MKSALPLLFLCLAACTRLESRHGETTFPPLPEDAPVRVVCSPEAPIWAAETLGISTTPPEGLEVGEIRVTFPKLREWGDVLEEVRARARALGGDIVILGSGENGLTYRSFRARVRRSGP